MKNNNRPDMILSNGKIITLDNSNSIVDAVLINGNIIAATGKTKDIINIADNNVKIIDLKGRCVVPGLTESHCHAASAGTELLNEINLSKVKTIQGIKDLVQNKRRSIGPKQWIKGIGYNENNLKEKRHVNRWDLDDAAKDSPVFIQRFDYHLGVANSEALHLAGINRDTFLDFSNGRIGREQDSLEPNGLLAEAAQGLVKDLIPPHSIGDIKKGLLHALKIMAKWGITSFTDAAVEHDSFVAYQELFLENKLPLKVGLIIEGFDALGFKGYFEELNKLGMQANFGNENLKIIGVKLFSDGSLSGGTAALHEHYNNNSTNYGVMNFEGEALIKQIKNVHCAGLRPIIHAIGDRAIDETLEGIEIALKARKCPDHRIRIEHCNLTTKRAVEKIKKHNIIVSSSITHLYELGAAHLKALGEKRIKNYFMLHELQRMGVKIIGNSDWPITCGNPFLGIHTAVNRKNIEGTPINEEQGISVQDALRLYTINAAYATFDENRKGSIETGKYADLVIIDQDIYEMPQEELKNIKVMATMANGKFIYKNAGSGIEVSD